MSRPFYTNVAALTKQLQLLETGYTTTFKKVNLLGEPDNQSRLRISILKLKEVISELNKIAVI